MAAQVRASVADEESQFIINRQVAALSCANPGVSSAFLLHTSHYLVTSVIVGNYCSIVMDRAMMREIMS